MFWKRKSFDPATHVDAIQQQLCFRCSGEYEHWDEMLHPSLFSYLGECGKILGQFVRYCDQCLVGEIFFLTDDGISNFTWKITLGYLPPTEFLGSQVPIENVVKELKPTDQAVTKFRLESRIFLDSINDGDRIRSFASPVEDWQQLCGRKGYAIIRNGKPVVAILTMLS